MGEVDHRREIRLAVAAAEAASDPERGALMDRTDLQRVIGQLLVTLQNVDRACECAERDRHNLAERLRRNHAGTPRPDMPPPPPPIA